MLDLILFYGLTAGFLLFDGWVVVLLQGFASLIIAWFNLLVLTLL